MKRKIPLLAVLLILTVNPASASILDNIWHIFVPQQQSSLVPQEDGNALYNELLTYNTSQNINLVSGYIQSFRVNVIQVHVVDYNSDFYVVKDEGLTSTLSCNCSLIKTINLTVPHIRKIEGYMAKGQLSWWDQWQLWMMYKQDGN
jgi:hypothetical protein